MRLFDPREFYVTGQPPGETYTPQPGDHPVVAYGTFREVDFGDGDLPVRMLTLTAMEVEDAMTMTDGYPTVNLIMAFLKQNGALAPALTALPLPNAAPGTPGALVYSVPEAAAMMDMFKGMGPPRSGLSWIPSHAEVRVLAGRAASVLGVLGAARDKMMETMR